MHTQHAQPVRRKTAGAELFTTFEPNGCPNAPCTRAPKEQALQTRQPALFAPITVLLPYHSAATNCASHGFRLHPKYDKHMIQMHQQRTAVLLKHTSNTASPALHSIHAIIGQVIQAGHTSSSSRSIIVRGCPDPAAAPLAGSPRACWPRALLLVLLHLEGGHHRMPAGQVWVAGNTSCRNLGASQEVGQAVGKHTIKRLPAA